MSILIRARIPGHDTELLLELDEEALAAIAAALPTDPTQRPPPARQARTTRAARSQTAPPPTSPV